MGVQFSDKEILEARRLIARRYRQSLDQVTGWDAEQYLKQKIETEAQLRPYQTTGGF